MIRARFQLRVPEEDWVGAVSRAFPDATFRLLSGLRTGDTAIELGEVLTDRPAAVGEAIESHPAIIDHQTLEVTADRRLGKYETTETGFYELGEELSTPPEFPLVVRDGWVEFDLTATREEFDGFLAGLDAAGEQYELLSVIDADRPETILTERQQEVLETALREGYFTIPRDSTLSEVADTLDVDKSTASDVLRRGENRLMKWFFTGVNAPGTPDY